MYVNECVLNQQLDGQKPVVITYSYIQTFFWALGIVLATT